MDYRTLRGTNALVHHAELMRRLVEPVRRLGWPCLTWRPTARPDRRLAAWLGGRLLCWGADLARYGRPAAARRTA